MVSTGKELTRLLREQAVCPWVVGCRTRIQAARLDLQFSRALLIKFLISILLKAVKEE